MKKKKKDLQGQIFQKDGILAIKFFGEDLSTAIEIFDPQDRVKITIEKLYKKRSIPQNSLIHVYFKEIADETGNSLEDVKDALKKQFLTVYVTDKEGNPLVNPKTGEVLERVKNTSELTTIEMVEFCEQVRIFALDFGIELPIPGDQQEIKL